ncbi:MAG: hypothetical protein PHZ05_08970, partial [Pygmaiobacter massiliensis]|nr:hypothetical protein [Pygmaiobacter massiliensis]
FERIDQRAQLTLCFRKLVFQRYTVNFLFALGDDFARGVCCTVGKVFAHSEPFVEFGHNTPSFCSLKYSKKRSLTIYATRQWRNAAD